VRYFTSPRFWKRYSNLPADVRRLADNWQVRTHADRRWLNREPLGGAGVRRLASLAAGLARSAPGLLGRGGGLLCSMVGGFGWRWAVVALGAVAPPNTRCTGKPGQILG